MHIFNLVFFNIRNIGNFTNFTIWTFDGITKRERELIIDFPLNLHFFQKFIWISQVWNVFYNVNFIYKIYEDAYDYIKGLSFTHLSINVYYVLFWIYYEIGETCIAYSKRSIPMFDRFQIDVHCREKWKPVYCWLREIWILFTKFLNLDI